MPARAPHNTYRLQITADFDLFEAARRLPYLHDLGVDWVYLSPILVAEPGSTHGYDVVAHDTIDPERGGPEGLAALSAEARRLGLGVLVDIVPNHVGVASPKINAWWWDLLTHGRESAYASYFDVDWDFGNARLRIPVIGDGDEGSIQVAEGEVRYHDHRFPLAPGTSSHDEQHYELVSWRAADSELNYRRFFAVNTLAAIRVEDREVFDASHVEIRRWFDEGLVDGLRVDHPDGLRDPRGYLDDLAGITGGAYVLVEKILEEGEDLPTSWATAGTTGYDALALVDRVLTDPAARGPLDDLEARLRGSEVDWHALIRGTKRMIADGILNSEVRRIVRELPASVEGVGVAALEDAVAELLACFPVYRSYLPDEREHLDAAFAAARRSRPDLTVVLDALEPVLGDPTAEAALRFQQTSGMVMAKGVEDTAFYRYSRLTSLNEVGGDPGVFCVGVDVWHDRMATRQGTWPDAMTTLSTHDTKRGEDVRARITVLSELPEVWEESLSQLLELVPAPDPGFASLLWQAVLGSWPASRERLHAYAEKAMREAGDRTLWTEPNADYEAAVHAMVDAAFDNAQVGKVLDGLLDRVVAPGWVNSLAAKLLAITMPGVPDVYQGSELWEQSLVDPDNRRAVDLDARASLLAGLDESAPAASVALDDLGVDKLLVTTRALTLRRDRPELFTSYSPVTASGEAADHVLAFDRGGAVTVVTRLPVGLAARGGWGDTTLALPDGRWRDSLTGRSVSAEVADVLRDLPVALLVKEDS
ncbi:malto-oligosyltrehalose synthase [Nocardioides szechwanensis]|uniref:Maltooligosyl trehalose synthase n=1 Tax=Nocardioides szechwanensis TaxID=1005944 RepID=A0A1G9XHK9_9ACTN|nr:malto-oligosyltrehalose synthase [Nocardioides szechwanensis]GEP32308.1 malto-oligosyltrehalose synthase [Nocardioides szechwanensis]SDM96322.1 maltooligosyl trehalose synthase [Nocardioides szechwanensis]